MLRDVFIIEGANDAADRKVAQDCTAAILKFFSKKQEPAYVGTDDEGNVAAFYSGKSVPAEGQAKEILRSMAFFICAVPPNSNRTGASYTYDDQDPTPGVMSIYFKPRGKKVSEEAWKWYVSDHALTILNPAKQDLIHEFTHAVDMLKVKDPEYMRKKHYDTGKLYSGDKEERKKYINHPLEYNALMQQYMDDFERLLAKEPKGNRTAYLARKPAEVVSDFYQMTPPEFRDYLTPKTKRHVLKRLTQFMNDMRRKYAG